MKGLAAHGDSAAAPVASPKRVEKWKKQVPPRTSPPSVNIKSKFLGSGELANLVSCQNRFGRLTTQRKLK